MSWGIVSLGEICEIINGGTPKSKVEEYWEGDIQWLTPKDMGKLDSRYVDSSGRQISQAGLDNSSAKLIPENSVILSCRAPIGHLAINRVPMSFNQGCKGLVPKKDIEATYLFYFLLCNKELLNDLGSGTTFKEISSKVLSKVELPLPPLPVQKQIVEKLDAAFADIDRAISVTEKNIENISYLLESFSNKYMFDNRNNFKTALIGDLFDLSTGGTPSKKKSEYFSDGEIPWLVSGDIHQQEIIDCAGRITEEGYKNSSAKFLPINSVLIALNGQGKTRGTVAMLKIKATCNQSLVSIYPKNSKTILPEYLYFNLKNRYSEIRKITGDSGNDRRGLNMPLIRKISFSYPENIEEQSKYIEKSKNLISHINHLNEKYEKKLIDLDNLKNSILNQAFSGELTKDAA